MLNTRQAGIDDGLWKQHEAMNKEEVLRQLLTHWPHDQPLRLEELEVAEWVEIGCRVYGTRIKASKVAHGIVREIDSYGYFADRTVVNGKYEGLVVGYWNDRVKIYYFKGGESQADFGFHPLENFKETGRDDK